MVKKGIIPKPESSFLQVRCSKCSNEQIVFDRSSITINCNVCDEVISEPSGGKASIKGEILLKGMAPPKICQYKECNGQSFKISGKQFRCQKCGKLLKVEKR